MHHPFHPGLGAGPHQGGGQGNVGAFKRGIITVQNRHQIDHRIVPGDQTRQRSGVMDIRFQYIKPWQVLHQLGVFTPSRGYGHTVGQTGEFFTDMATDKAGSA